MDSFYVLTCGSKDTDYPGFDNTAIQRAADRVAAVGGGEVHLSAGEFILRDSVHIKDNVRITGEGIDRTVLKKNASVQGLTAAFCGFGHREIIVADSSLFDVGDGVYIKSDGYYGFHATQTTIMEIDGNTLFLADPLCSDVHSAYNGRVTTIFPMIKGVRCEGVTVSDLTLEGNSENNLFLEGCRGGAIYLIGCKNIHINRVKITDFNGEGFSYQQCRNIHIENSSCCNNRGNGLHPGSGTVGMVIRNCDISNNDRAGIHNCLRISYQICCNNRICDNGKEGIEIGHRDDYLEIFDNIISGNGSEGIYFRADDCPGMSGRFVSIHNNQIKNNATRKDTAQIYAPTSVSGLELYNNRIGGPFSFLCDDRLYESYLWKNQCEGIIVCKNDTQAQGYTQDAPTTVRKIDIEAIPEKEFRHL